MSQEAPGALELVRGFVNSIDVERGGEALGSPAGLVAWLAERDLVDPGVEATEAELARAVALREALRDVLLSHHAGAGDPPEAAVATVEDAARRARLEVRFGPGGRARIEPASDGVDGALGRLLAIVADAQTDGTWTRLKVCPWETCRWAFYDHSRNRSGVWCDMAVCGNRAKAAAFRRRRRGAAAER